MQIRCFETADLPQILMAHQAVLTQISNSAFFNWPKEMFTEELKVSKALIAEDAKGLQGFVVFRENEELLEIMVLGTQGLSRQQGCMSALLQHLKLYAAQQGKPITLEVHHENAAARGLYLKSAFKLSHQRPCYYKDGAAADVYVWKKT